MKALAPILLAVAAVVAPSSVAHADALEDPSGHFRVDADRFGLQAWALAQFPVSADVAIAGNVYAIEPGSTSLTAAPGPNSDHAWRPHSRIDAGVIARIGVLEVFPKLGLSLDFGGTSATALVPQVFAIVRGGPVHFETWNQLFWASALDKGSLDVFYTRNQLLVSPWSFIGFGFQIELTLAVHNQRGDSKLSLPIGGVVTLQPSETDVIGVFLGAETDEGARNFGDGVTGRLTYVHTF